MESNLTVHHLNADLGYRSTKALLVNQVITHAGHYTILDKIMWFLLILLLVLAVTHFQSMHGAFHPSTICPWIQ